MRASIPVAGSALTPLASNLGSKHCRAICEEIGERLALVLRPATELPPRLKDLLDQLALLDHDSPSIVPDIEDMAALDGASLVQSSR
jgi:hypothetical protein